MANRVPSLIPGLDHGLLRDAAARELDHGRAEHLRAVGIGAGLRESEPVAFGEADVDLVRHCPAADIVPEGVDRGPALDHARLARRIVAIDDAHYCVIGVEACEHAPVAAFDGALDGRGGDLIGLRPHWSLLSFARTSRSMSRCPRLCFAGPSLVIEVGGLPHDITCWRPSPCPPRR